MQSKLKSITSGLLCQTIKIDKEPEVCDCSRVSACFGFTHITWTVTIFKIDITSDQLNTYIDCVCYILN